MERQRLLFISITALGISSIITQIIVMREFLSVFYGNELVFGIILANWFLLTGSGSYLGRYAEHIKKKEDFLAVCQIAIAVLPFLHILLIRVLRNIIFPPGVMVDVIQIFVFSLILLLPYCLISGFLLPMAAVIYSPARDATQIGKVYFIDNIGDILGGFLFSFLLVYFLDPFQILFFVMAVNLVAAYLVASFTKRNDVKIFIGALFLLVSLAFVVLDINDVTSQLMFKGQELVYQKSTPYGNIVVTRSLDQLNFYENGVPLFTTANTIANEETVHYAMVQRSSPDKVLLISGGVAGTLDEILKYNVTRVDYVELDPHIIEIGKRFTSALKDKRINVISGDGRLYVKRAEEKYDVIIVDLPDPSSAQINRFYTEEFYSEAKRILKKDGVVSISLTAPANYLSPEIRNLNSALYKAMRGSFSNVIIIPGERNFFLASDGPLSYDIASLVRRRSISTEYVNEDYLRGKLTEDRIRYVLDSVNEDVPPNRDLNPISYYYHLLYWVSHFGKNLIAFSFLLAVLALIFMLRLRPITFSIFTTGFAGAGLEVVLLVGFQILYGYVYHMLGVIITAFMVGLAVGAYIANMGLREMGRREFVLMEVAIAVLSMLISAAIIWLNTLESVRAVFLGSKIIFPLLASVLAILVGMEFPLASKLSFEEVASTSARLYNADLIGASVGALVVSTLLIPILGIVKVCLLVGAMNIASGTLVSLKG
jgi:spermidine synthase